LFPLAAINRMLVNDRMPARPLSDRLTRIFGTVEWEKEFYSTTSWKSPIDPDKGVERVHKTVDQNGITEFFVKRLKQTFAAVAEPGFLFNSKGVLFVLLFAAGNKKGATPAVKIANDLIRDLNQSLL
jgi:hypothetical protein